MLAGFAASLERTRHSAKRRVQRQPRAPLPPGVAELDALYVRVRASVESMHLLVAFTERLAAAAASHGRALSKLTRDGGKAFKADETYGAIASTGDS